MNPAPCPSWNPAIVVLAYNRPDSLSALLSSLKEARYSHAGLPTLVISVDSSDTDTTARLASDFVWAGPKHTILHSQNIGLREHVLSCGDLTEQFGSIILLEDDLLVAEDFYNYAQQSLTFYQHERRIAGISLYNYTLNEFDNEAFEPIEDGSDVYFLQIAASWGQAWSRSQWMAFRKWYAAGSLEPISASDGVPRQLASWKESSWKKYFIKYLSLEEKFFVYPRRSLSVNTARPGTHTKRQVNIYQTPLARGELTWRFSAFDVALAVYDSFYELRPETLRSTVPQLAGEQFDVDLAGRKPFEALKHKNLLSSRPCRSPAASFGLGHAPLPMNIVFLERGSFFSLGPRASFSRQTLRRRLSISRVLNPRSYLNKLLFQILKPIQSGFLQLLRPRRRLRSAR